MPLMPLMLAVLIAGCSAHSIAPKPSFEAGKKAWVDALESGDHLRVWAMMSDTVRHQFKTPAAFASWYQKHGSSLLVEAMSHDMPEPVTVMTGGLELVTDGASFRIRRSLVNRPAQTVSEALSRFITQFTIPSAISMRTRERYLRFRNLAFNAIKNGPPAIRDGEKRVFWDLSFGGSVVLIDTGSGWTVDHWQLPR